MSGQRNHRRELFFADQLALTEVELEKIVQCVALYADAVWLPNDAHPATHLPRDAAERIRRQVSALVEAGLVHVWDIEWNRRSSIAPPLVPSSLCRTIPYAEYESMLMRINRVVAEQSGSVERTLPPNSHLGPQPTIDGFAELVALRGNLYSALIADYLGTTSSLARNEQMTSLGRQVSSLLNPSDPTLASLDVLRRFSEWQSLAGFAFMSPKSLLEIRKNFPAFREFFSDQLRSPKLRLASIDDMQRDFEAVKIAFTEDLEDEITRLRPRIASPLADAVITVVGHFFWYLSFLHAKGFVEWAKHRSAPPHLLYVMNIRKRLPSRRRS